MMCHKGYNIETTGHSLGGAIAEYINTNNQNRVKNSVTFSRGSGPMDLLKKKSNTVYDFSNRYDGISAFARLQNKLSGKKQTVATDYKFGLNHSLKDLAHV